jgi:hypothetical protein
MTKPDNWNISERGVVAQRPEGRDAVSSALKELEATGYLRPGEGRNGNGKFVGGDGDLLEEPWPENSSKDSPPQVITKEDGSTNHGLAPFSDKPDNRDPDCIIRQVNVQPGTSLRCQPGYGREC